MASFYAELYVEGRIYPVLRCSIEFGQATRERGRVTGRVRHGPLRLQLDVPDDNGLLAWAAAPHKKLGGHLIFFDTARLSPHESVQFEEGECVLYQEDFEPAARPMGAYRCTIQITAPRFVLGNGFPAATPRALPQQLLAAAAGPTPHLAAQLQEVIETKLQRYQKRLRLLDSGRRELDRLTMLTKLGALLPEEVDAAGAVAAAPGPLARLGTALGLRGGAAASPPLTAVELQQADKKAKLGAAVERLAFNNVAVERARLSAHAYAFTTTPDAATGALIPRFTQPEPEGWQALQVWDDPGSGFAAALYDSSFEEPRHKVLAFRGTNPSEWADIKADGAQALGLRTEQYEQAIRLAQDMKAVLGDNVEIVESPPVDVTGHSLGGGLAAAASVVTGLKGYTFNAAGLHPRTVGRYGVTPAGMPTDQIDNVYSSQDLLNWAQNHLGGLIPKSVGRPHVLPGAGFHPITGVVEAIEQQKDEDTATIKRLTAPH